MWKTQLFAVIAIAQSPVSLAFQRAAYHRRSGYDGSKCQRVPSTTIATSAGANVIVSEQDKKRTSSGECYYRRIDGSWKPRKDINSLFIGERLFATRLPESDIVNGKTGPKVFFECGVGRKTGKGKWKIVNGMARLGRRGMKPSVVRKKIMKMPHDSLIEVYVSRIRLEQGKFEVCLSREDALEIGSQEGKIPASKLKAGDELTGIVKRVVPYGVFVDVNANRNGLVHISKVANQQNAFIAKEEGLKRIGLKQGTPVSVIVLSNEKKRLELDLAPDIEESPSTSISNVSEEEAAAAAAYGTDEGSDGDNTASEDEAAMWAAYGTEEGGDGDNAISEDEAALWAAYADSDGSDEEDDYDDEDTDIEDALGIGYY
ncbi:hypothetical protein ACHAWF_003517 [Thalassiosira exigua]